MNDYQGKLKAKEKIKAARIRNYQGRYIVYGIIKPDLANEIIRANKSLYLIIKSSIKNKAHINAAVRRVYVREDAD